MFIRGHMELLLAQHEWWGDMVFTLTALIQPDLQA
jgi:hypothetical protein